MNILRSDLKISLVLVLADYDSVETRWRQAGPERARLMRQVVSIVSMAFPRGLPEDAFPAT
jgi:hypothetical protein